MKIIFFILIYLGFLISCQQKPTKVGSSMDIQYVAQKDLARNFLRKNPVILDARSFIDFSISHTPGAKHIRWEDYSQTTEAYKGVLLEDKFAMARELARMGIDPETPVLVVGYGTKGKGEDGRIAWQLKLLGIKDVVLGQYEHMPMQIPREEFGPESRPMWKPEVKTNLEMNFAQFKNESNQESCQLPITTKSRKTVMGEMVTSVKKRDCVVLDVRAMQLQKPKSLKEYGVKLRTLEMDWKSFVDEESRPRSEIQKWLLEHDVDFKTEIFVIGENGVDSALVTFALNELGYHVRNFSGGTKLLDFKK